VLSRLEALCPSSSHAEAFVHAAPGPAEL
jgi:hypothetical protein